MDDRDAEAQELHREAREASAKLPAGLEDSGRDEELVHDREVQPSGARSDRRHSAPGTMIPGAPEPAAASGEWQRIQRAAKRRQSAATPPHEDSTRRGE
jgi:hypothetical protein